jgi:basic membrane protein A
MNSSNRVLSVVRGRGVLVLVTTLAAITTLSACGTSGDKSNGDSKRQVTVALVSPQASGDGGAIDSLLAGLKVEADKHDLKTRFVYVKDAATTAATLDGLATSGTDIVLTAFGGFSADVEEAAGSHPETRFVQILGNPTTQDHKNDLSLVGDAAEAYFLAGAASAALTATGELGYVGGASEPLTNTNINSFMQGADKSNSGSKTTPVFANSFQDPAKGEQLAKALYGKGVDIILPDAAGTNPGVYKAATSSERNLVDVVVDPTKIAVPKRTVGYVLLDFHKMIEIGLNSALKETMDSGTVTVGFKDKVADFIWNDAFEPSPAMGANLDRAKAKVEALRKELTDGSIVVERKPTL